MCRKNKKRKESIPELPKTKLVFLDESGVNTDMARRYGRTIGKQRVVDAVPLNTPKTMTVLSAMRLDGQFAGSNISAMVIPFASIERCKREAG